MCHVAMTKETLHVSTQPSLTPTAQPSPSSKCEISTHPCDQLGPDSGGGGQIAHNAIGIQQPPRVGTCADQWTDWDKAGISSIKLALGKETLESVKQEQGVLANSTENKKCRDMTKGFSTKLS